VITFHRHQYILKRLQKEGSIQVAGLAEQLGVTSMTIWRDLQALEERGLLRRIRGGALSPEGAQEPEFRIKEHHASAEKRRIAAYAATQYVGLGDTIIMEGGTTVAEMLNHLKPERLTLMTNSLPILSRAYSQGKSWHLHASGGVLSPVSGNFVGPEAIRFFSGKHAQTFFMSATGLDPDTGALTDPNPVEIDVKRVMADCAKEIVLLLDSSKLGMRSMQEVLPLKRISAVITDKKIKPQDLRKLKAAGLKVDVR
jgi:DeoR/GlpR family transcriptional regulator of sugar metabolism